jgi:hypothetical protein
LSEKAAAERSTGTTRDEGPPISGNVIRACLSEMISIVHATSTARKITGTSGEGDVLMPTRIIQVSTKM